MRRRRLNDEYHGPRVLALEVIESCLNVGHRRVIRAARTLNLVHGEYATTQATSELLNASYAELVLSSRCLTLIFILMIGTSGEHSMREKESMNNIGDSTELETRHEERNYFG